MRMRHGGRQHVIIAHVGELCLALKPPLELWTLERRDLAWAQVN